MERYDDAIASCDQALQIKPDYVLALREKGNALYKLQRYEAAIAAFDQTLKIDSEDYLWTKSYYFVSTAGNISNETIKPYIEGQKKTWLPRQ